jgi:hypothetical protein
MIHSLPKSLIESASNLLKTNRLKQYLLAEGWGEFNIDYFVECLTEQGLNYEVPTTFEETFHRITNNDYMGIIKPRPGSRRMIAELVAPIYNMDSIHSDNRTHEIPDIIKNVVDAKLSESSDDTFKHWIHDTDHQFTRLSPHAYLNYGNIKDDVQIGQRGATIPMSHPKLFEDHMKNLNVNDQHIIHKFIHIGLQQTPPHKSGSVRLNHHLLGASNAGMMHKPVLQYDNGDSFSFSHMDDALDKNKLQHKLVTYSGVNFDPSEKMSEYGFINSPTYLSSSTRKFVAAKYAAEHLTNDVHHIIELHHNVGDSGIYVGNRTKLSSFSDDEFIMPRNSVIKMDGAYDDYHHIYNSKQHTFRVWKASRHDQTQQYDESVEPLKFTVDNPGGDWLDYKQQQAREFIAKHRDDNSSLGKGFSGAVTGYYNKPLNLPVRHLTNLPGAMGEEEYRSDTNNPKMHSLEKEIGDPKNFDSKAHPIFIAVNHMGHSYVIEGNHRLEYARKHGISHIHAEVRYFNGGEAVNKQMHPDKLKQLHTE